MRCIRKYPSLRQGETRVIFFNKIDNNLLETETANYLLWVCAIFFCFSLATKSGAVW